jgi:hypothetical protein
MVPIPVTKTAQGWQAECNAAGESALMCGGSQIRSLLSGF